LFKVDSEGFFSVLESYKSYLNYLIYVEAKNEFGIAGGSDQYIIDISYKVLPQFISNLGAIIVLINENSFG